MPHICDGYSVGAIITQTVDGVEKMLLIERSDGLGFAPVAGHVFDENNSIIAALYAEVWEEAGLTVVDYKPVIQGLHLPNRCSGKVPARQKPGHEWWVYYVTTTGELNPSITETHGAAYYDWAEINDMAIRTCEYILGQRTAAELKKEPFLEAPWVLLLHQMGWVSISDATRDKVLSYVSVPPQQR